jgi:hypothetical protein
MALQPHPLTSVMQLSITAASLCVAAAAITFAIKSMSDERNARLVEIGVGILSVDPAKEAQVSAARNWALDLIDANAGGIKFSREARKELLERRLDYSQPIDWSYPTGNGTIAQPTGNGTVPGRGTKNSN